MIRTTMIRTTMIRATMIRATSLAGIVIFSLGCVAGCSQEAARESAPSPADAKPSAAVGSVRDQAVGRQVYADACALCHDNGIGGAPRIGDKQAWSQRSRLWTAVLSEHAKRGYLDMPEKGGNKTLSDAAVAAASEYILSQTYPELPSSD